MKFLVIDSAGRFLSRNQRFDTYYHNDAFDFKSIEEAESFVKSQVVYCEVSTQ
ncbi:hypothetical protein D051_0964 [Vibrio parahaemolyticus VPCR-2010]|uniref:hypothetical protein n=1 Tax=Vibrio TaxID=662 RepID=UPI00038E5B01|nr:hypothetical protein [Vibrio parahaemolyticus]EJG0764876.1 hypothetical protein [Vibrio parahaemolyticus O5:K30]EQM48113.1 hypothetical protein D051_0964 [Vibrio parahaemolyticus VPCR-2010]MCS0115152.1 hypothetical protein [Vibrio parahaemolyticus]